MQRIFVVGCPRSGTTLLQSLLGTHRDLLTFTESAFFPKYFNHRLGLVYRVRADLPERVVEFLQENGLPPTPLRRPIRVGVTSRWGAEREARTLVQLLDDLAAAAGKTAWLEKTPHNVLRLPLIEAAAPGARFIHIVRSPEPTILSLRKASAAWRRELDWRTSAKTWMEAARLSVAAASRPDHTLVLYEDLVEQPDAVIRALVGWLGLDPEAYRLDDYVDVAKRIVVPREHWKANNVREIGSAAEPELAAELTPPDIRALLSGSGLYEAARAAATR